MKKKKNKLGISLVFAHKISKQLMCEKRDYVIRNLSNEKIEEKAKNLGWKYVENKGNCCKYLGINDIYEIYGELNSGSIMGVSTYKSYRTLTKAKKMIGKKLKSKLLSTSYKPKDFFYNVKAVYFVGTPHKSNEKRTILFDVLIKSRQKEKLIEKAQDFCNRKIFISKIESLYNHNNGLSINLRFLGLSEINFCPEPVKLNNCFSSFSKPFKNIQDIKKLVCSVNNIAK